MLITIKELEKAGVGVIREDLVKKTMTGKIYNANLYRNDQAIKVTILYYNRGGSKLIDITEDNEAESINEYVRLLKDVIKLKAEKRRLMKNDTELQLIRAAMLIGLFFTGLNTIEIRKVTDILYVTIDLILLAIVRWLYRREGKRYEEK